MNNYVDFVKQTTSEPSLEYGAMASRLAELEVTGTNTTQLLTAALGLTAESGEFTEVVKKILFQGKPYNEENVFHMKREPGDICRAPAGALQISVGILLKHLWHLIQTLMRFLI